MDLALKNRRVLVTGGASGIGAATAGMLVEHGCSVVLADLDVAALEQAAHVIGAAAAVGGDITSETDAERMVSATLAACGGIDGLVHCAGVSDRVVKFDEMPIDEWQRIVDITLRGAFLVSRAAARPMRAQRSGSMVLLTSVNGLNGIPRRHAYGPAKAGVAIMARNLACELGGDNVRVNAVAPGYIRTPMVANLIAQKRFDVTRVEERTPMARFGESSEVAAAIAFLLSDWASYITGSVLAVDGGWLAYGGAGPVGEA